MDAFPPEFEQKPLKRIVAAENPYFGPPTIAIKQLILFNKKNRNTNHFCVVAYVWSNDGVHDVTVWVHWLEEQRLLQWRGSSDQEMRESGLVFARPSLKLGKDTVETTADLHGSTHRETHAWWQAVSKDCALHGQKYTIMPFARKTPK